MNKGTTALERGDTVITTEPAGDDFGIPLVDVHHGRRNDGPTVPRVVRNVVRTGPGSVVWFIDGTKSRPIHGRTAWQLAVDG